MENGFIFLVFSFLLQTRLVFAGTKNLLAWTDGQAHENPNFE